MPLEQNVARRSAHDGGASAIVVSVLDADLLDGHAHRVAQAVERLSKDFDRSPRFESIAQELGMSTSGFHDRFKAIAALRACDKIPHHARAIRPLGRSDRGDRAAPGERDATESERAPRALR